eukprot:246309-Prymnesium_polylepis.1
MHAQATRWRGARDMAWGMWREGSVLSRGCTEPRGAEPGVHGAEGCRAGAVPVMWGDMEPVRIHARRRSQPGGLMEWPDSN